VRSHHIPLTSTLDNQRYDNEDGDARNDTGSRRRGGRIPFNDDLQSVLASMDGMVDHMDEVTSVKAMPWGLVDSAFAEANFLRWRSVKPTDSRVNAPGI
jgi:hypothetical protein